MAATTTKTTTATTMTAIAVVAAPVVAEAPVFWPSSSSSSLSSWPPGYEVLPGNHRPAAIAQSLVRLVLVVIVVAPAFHSHRRRHPTLSFIVWLS